MLHRLRHPGTSTLVAAVAGLLLAGAAMSAAAEPSVHAATDTLDVAALNDASTAARGVLDAVRWEPGPFEVMVQRDEPRAGDADARVSFASPRSDDGRPADEVPLLWYVARGGDGAPLDAPAPAVLVVHTIHPQLLVGKTIARNMARQGVHAFVVQLPGFGERAGGEPGVLTLLKRAGQAAAEVRRARDAVAALPGVAPGAIALQATSLGGFVATVAAALDEGFNPVLLVLTGANGFDALQNGQADAAVARAVLARHGYADDTLRELVDRVEPVHVAHRLAPKQTWLFTARQDQVIPAASAEALARAIDLHVSHHVQVDGDHYSAALLLPGIVRQMVEQVHDAHRPRDPVERLEQ
ncbi:MAG: hypothetical protein WD118_03650 [Phycisphaeraceae bacterium]